MRLLLTSGAVGCYMCAGEILDKLVSTLPPPKDMEAVDEKEKLLAIAIVGRPNVGELDLSRQGRASLLGGSGRVGSSTGKRGDRAGQAC